MEFNDFISYFFEGFLQVLLNLGSFFDLVLNALGDCLLDVGDCFLDFIDASLESAFLLDKEESLSAEFFSLVFHSFLTISECSVGSFKQGYFLR